MRKFTIIIPAVVLGSGLLGVGRAAEPLDTIQRVYEQLGAPNGYINIDGSEVLYYDRGHVELTDGIVTSSELLSVEAFTLRREREERERVLRAEELREKRERRFAKGSRDLADRLSDDLFMNSPASKRLAYWREFHRKYPEVTLPEDFMIALREREAEIRVQRSEQRVRELERQAEEESSAMVRDERRFNARTYSPYPYPYCYVRSPTYVTRNRGHKRHLHRSSGHANRSRFIPFHSIGGYAFQREVPQRSGIRTRSRHERSRHHW